jgi:hypothetical protein
VSTDLTADVLAPLAVTMNESTVASRPRVHLLEANTVEMIASRVRASGIKWVWVEGFSQAGKSKFAAKLAHALAWEQVIHLDHMAIKFEDQPKDSPRYADHLDRDRIRVALQSEQPLVIEGVCLQEVVQGMRTDRALRIYIARVSKPGTDSLIWHDGTEILDAETRLDEVSCLSIDIAEYHRRVRPHASADYVLVRIEGQPTINIHQQYANHR